MLNRREFISAVLGTSFGAALGADVYGLPGDKFRWAINTHMFTPLKPYPETGIKMAARFGFHGVEPWGNEMQKYLTQPPEVFKKVLDESGVGISSIASGGEYFDASKLQATLDSHGANAKFGSYFGITALKANLSRRLGPENLSRREWQDPREESERGRQAHTRARRQVCVSSACLDDRRAQG